MSFFCKFLFFFLLALSTNCTSSSIGTNLIPNGNFDSGLGSWRVWPPGANETMTLSSSSFNGGDSLQLSNRLSTTWGAYYDMTNILSDGWNFEFSWAFYCEASVWAQARFRIQDGFGTRYQYIAGDTNAAQVFAYMVANTTIRLKEPVKEILLLVDGPDAGLDFLFDDIAMVLANCECGPCNETGVFCSFENDTQPISNQSFDPTANLIYRVNAGGPYYYSIYTGKEWWADQYFLNEDSVVFSTNRWQATQYPFYYLFPVDQNGWYKVNLYYAENWSGAMKAGVRFFNVSLEGNWVQVNFDMLDWEPWDTAFGWYFYTYIADNTVDIEWFRLPNGNNPQVNGIEILQVKQGVPIPSQTSGMINFNQTNVIAISNNSTVGESQKNDTALIGGVLGGVAAVCLIAAMGLIYAIRKRKFSFLFGSSWQVQYEDLVFEKRIGVGSFGEVYLGQYRGTQVAIKKLLNQKLNAQLLKDFSSEAALMCDLRHPHIVLFMGACVTPPNLCMVTEFMVRGNLYDLLHNEMITFSWALKADMARKAALGMNYLHTSKPPIIHGDFKSLNLLVDAQWNVKVSDFGLSKFKSENEDDPKKKKHSSAGLDDQSKSGSFINAPGEKASVQGEEEGNVGSILWAAPEVLKHASNASIKADVYSYGIVMWELATRQDPWADIHLHAVPAAVIEGRRPPLPEDCPIGPYLTLMQRCWSSEQGDRPSFQDVVEEFRQMEEDETLDDLGQLVPTETAPRGTLALVFTDVKSSTALWEFDPQAMLQALEVHDALLREMIKKHLGYYVKSEGDSFMVAFRTAEAALYWCFDVQEGLMKANWPTQILTHEAASPVMSEGGKEIFRGLCVRMGVHWGNPNCREDPSTGRMDYFGSMVNKSARIEGQAKGGQILVSGEFYKEIETIDGLGVSEMGTARLKGIEGVTSLFAVFPQSLRDRNEYFMTQRLLSTHGETATATLPFDTTGTESTTSLTDSMLVGSIENSSLLDTGDQDEYAKEEAKKIRSTKTDWKIVSSQLQLKERIGAGSYGEIFRAVYQGTPVAVKKLLNQQAGQQLIYNLQKECLILLHLRHPNIVMFMGACFEPGNLCIVTDFCSNGSVASYIENRVNPLDWRLRIKIARETAQGMNYLHNRNPKIIHCDLKPSNLLLDHAMSTKICDFGMSKVKHGNKTMTHTQGATLAYTAPEVLKGEKYSEAIDVYSYGMILYELYERVKPTAGVPGIQFLTKVVRENYRPPTTKNMPELYVALLRDCWSADPKQRPTFEQMFDRLDEIEKRVFIL